jgi:DNA-binding PadR family transcriptional regulator
MVVGTNERSDEQELENLAAEGYIRFDHMDEKGQKIYVLTELGQCVTLGQCVPSENPFIEPVLKDLAAEGYIRFDHMDELGQFTIRKKPFIKQEFEDMIRLIDLKSEGYRRFYHMDEKGQKIFDLSKWEQFARMTSQEHRALAEKLLQDMVAEGLLCVDHIDKIGRKVIAITELGRRCVHENSPCMTS